MSRANPMSYIEKMLNIKDQASERISEAKSKANVAYHQNLINEGRMMYQAQEDEVQQCLYSQLLNG